MKELFAEDILVIVPLTQVGEGASSITGRCLVFITLLRDVNVVIVKLIYLF